MPVTYRVDPRDQIVYITTRGPAYFGEWREVMLAAIADPTYRRGFNFLSDQRAQTNVPGSGVVRAEINFLSEHSFALQGSKWASVSDVTALYGFLRMFAELSAVLDITVEAFKDYEEARQWLLSEASPDAPGVSTL